MIQTSAAIRQKVCKVSVHTIVLIPLLLVIGLLLFLLIMGIMLWLNKYTRQKEVVVVPEIKGMTLAVAERR
ncbi:hypothetical protein EZS27_042249, partial [termite gut metagenome]